MGKCVSMTSDTVELRKTDYNSFNPYQTKITESDYSFLRPPPNIHDGKNNLAEEKKNHSRPLSKQDYYKTNPDLKEEQEKAFKRMDKQHLDLFPNSLASQLEKDDQLLNAYNTKSKIIKVSKKKPQKVQKGKTEKSEDLQVIEDLGKNEVIYGRLINEKIYSVISLQHDDVDMQFILPKCRAGPLMVPYLDYDKYSPQSI